MVRIFLNSAIASSNMRHRCRRTFGRRLEDFLHRIRVPTHEYDMSDSRLAFGRSARTLNTNRYINPNTMRKINLDFRSWYCASNLKYFCFFLRRVLSRKRVSWILHWNRCDAYRKLQNARSHTRRATMIKTIEAYSYVVQLLLPTNFPRIILYMHAFVRVGL
jgi:hypothetical protein